VRDRSGVYGDKVIAALEAMDIEQKAISARSPWQKRYCERVVGTLKRACLNHMIVFGESHPRRIIRNYVEYYHGSRTHLGLEKDTPDRRAVEPPDRGPVKRRPMVGGLHSRYYREAA
jgi:hypothetical protein